MATIYISSAFVDCIERILYYQKPNISTHKTVRFDKENSGAEEISIALKSCISFTIGNGYIEVEVPRSDKEVECQKAENEKALKGSLHQLAKWRTVKAEYKKSIDDYLKLKGYETIIDALKQ